MTLLEHLDELRVRLLRSVIAFIVGCIVGYFVAQPANELLTRPFEEASPTAKRAQTHDDRVLRLAADADGSLSLLRGEGSAPEEVHAIEIVDSATSATIVRVGPQAAGGLIFLKPLDPIMIRLRTTAILGFLFAFPVILWQTFAFVAPGLRDRERRALVPMLALSGVLFPAGVLFAYATLKYAILFLSEYGFGEVMVMNDARAYLGFALTTLVICGVVFELPVVVLIAVRTGLITVEALAAKRKPILVGIMVVSAILTPPDPLTMIALTIPLYGLFELSLLLGRAAGPKPDEAEPPGTSED